MKTFEVTTTPDGIVSCNLDITVKEWETVLSDPNICNPNFKKALLAFYREPGHKSTCKNLAVKYDGDPNKANAYNLWISKFGNAVMKRLNRFKIVDDKGEERRYLVPINPGRTLENGLFEWTLRPELVQAIENLGWNKQFTWIPFYMEMADKLLQYKDNRKSLVDIIYSLPLKYVGYIKDLAGGQVSDIDPFSVYGIINRGLTDTNRLDICSNLKTLLQIEAPLPNDFDSVPLVNLMSATFYWREYADTDIQPLWDFYVSVIENDESSLSRLFDKVITQHGVRWNITMGLYWIRPYDYISLDSRNREYLPKKGIEVFDESDFCYSQYKSLLNKVLLKINAKDINETSIPEITYNAWLNDTHNYWLCGYAFSSNNSQMDRFLEKGVWEGGFDENSKIDQKQIELVKSIRIGDILILKSTSTKGAKHDLPFLRVKAVCRVIGELSTQIKSGYTYFQYPVEYISTESKDFDGKQFGAYRKTIHKTDGNARPIIDYVNSILGTSATNSTNSEPIMKPSKYQNYIDLLQDCHNLVLTGAPGTGKTYMARAIAEDMGAEIEFVQFHPSYDYTDFVEGLRPSDDGSGQIGFERKDGIFKEFCARAIQNLEDSAKSVKNLAEEQTWREKLDQYVEDAIESEASIKLANGGDFRILEVKGNNIKVENPNNLKKTEIMVPTKDIISLLNNNVSLNNVREIRNYFERQYQYQCDSYTFAIVREVREMKTSVPTASVLKVEKKPFVFIIDEINRGEASKIFGELFFAIDPGYRGLSKNLVKTQYQNLVPSGDTFEKGFYVPENVYILATMNDIDRSVESMDFAMRRRFTWKEVTPEETQDMLDLLDESFREEAKGRMLSLNKVISETDGLGPAYMVGPSYFLKLNTYNGNFNRLWNMNIEPLLREYLRGFRKVDSIMEKLANAYNSGSPSIETDQDSSDLFENED